MSEFLKVSNLSLSINNKPLVHQLNFSIASGQTLGLIGESGSGKTITSLALARILPEITVDSGTIDFCGQDMTKLDNDALKKIRGRDIAYIFQEPLSALNPLHRVKKQIAEPLIIHKYAGNIDDRVRDLLEQTGLNPAQMSERYPHQLSGGQRQRVMIAMALANAPKLLIADEPTTALDRTIQWQILDLLKELQASSNLTLLLISHDLHLVRDYTDQLAIMRNGRLIEAGATKHIFSKPDHSYTRMLLEPLVQKPPTPVQKKLKPLLQVDDLTIGYPVRGGVFKRLLGYNQIVRNLSFCLHPGETLGLVGPSGSGKSSIALAILRLIESHGSIHFLDHQIDNYSRKQMRPLRRDMQIVFQDPFASLNPRMTLFQIICEGLAIHITDDKQEQRQLVTRVLLQVGLEPDMMDRFIHEFSGGQRQRVALARALVINPKLIILDEPTSSLDRSNQRQILTLLGELQSRHNLAYMLISHDQEAVAALGHQIIELDMEQNFSRIKRT